MSNYTNKGIASSVLPSDYEETWRAVLWDRTKVFSNYLIINGGASALAKTSVAPLERLKIILQTQPMSNISKEERYTSLRDAVRRLPAKEGSLAFWRGNGANVLRVVPEAAFCFSLHDQMETLFSPIDGRAPNLQTHLAAGAATGVTRTFLLHPLDLAHTRLAAEVTAKGQPRLYLGLVHCLLQTARLEGFRGLYKGVLASAGGIVPYMTTSFTIYHELSRQLPSDKQSVLSWWFPATKVAIGASASLVGQAVAYPIDTVRRRMQLSGAQGQAVSYSGYWQCARSMLQNEGSASFYRGLGINCLKVLPGATLQFLAYDVLRTGMLAVNRTAM